jgi:hypothetical protein
MGKARTLAMQGKVNEAAALYENFLLNHPRNPEIHSRLIELAYGPLQDTQYGERVVARATKRLSKRDGEAARALSESIICGQLFPLRHLGWCKDATPEHPQVEIPNILKGQFSKSRMRAS